MRRGPITALASALAAALLLAGCENRYNTSFVLQPGSAARFKAEGDRAWALIRNRGPSQIIATFNAEGLPPEAREIPPNSDYGQGIKKKSVTLLGGTGEAVVDIEVQNATGFELNLSPSGTPAAK
jgi:hypothetical protein